MDPQMTAHYRAAQRPPVFIRSMPKVQPQRPFWPLLVFAVIAGAMVVGGSMRLLQLIP